MTTLFIILCSACIGVLLAATLRVISHHGLIIRALFGGALMISLALMVYDSGYVPLLIALVTAFACLFFTQTRE